MSSKHKYRRAATERAFPLARTDPPAPLGGICRVVEPWAVDEAVCHDRPLPPHESIEARAREIWELRGRPTGADLEIWLEAQGQFVGASV